MANNESAEIGDDAGVGENSSDQNLASSQAPVAEQALLGSVGRSLILAAVSAVVVWGALRVMLPVFELPPHLRDLSGNAPEEQQNELMAASVATSHKNAAFAFATLAGLLALALAIAELMSRKQIGRASWGGPLAFLVAAGVAACGGMLGGSLATSTSLPEDPLTKTILLQVITLGVVGLGVGLGLSLAIMLPKIQPQLLGNCVVGGALGGALGGLIFPLASSVLLPSARTEVAMPDPGASRLLWLAVGAIMIALTTTGIGKGKKAA
ncbi:hypothetical protein [Fuerstiella marisgermanici]|uniref:Uncharacterized protein n=1 Tax=Fuerstiella marisgermanici TaxID=1891926 RepID=A0A1P8WHM2_9PLAN|nr:hypothetical protein [Fuerstiella marisgermanici]APZ93527.1 hypothetical protein Fuma_03145 [Fuerstiella marisgermanici]